MDVSKAFEIIEGINNLRSRVENRISQRRIYIAVNAVSNALQWPDEYDNIENAIKICENCIDRLQCEQSSTQHNIIDQLISSLRALIETLQ